MSERSSLADEGSFPIKSELAMVRVNDEYLVQMIIGLITKLQRDGRKAALLAVPTLIAIQAELEARVDEQE